MNKEKMNELVLMNAQTQQLKAYVGEMEEMLRSGITITHANTQMIQDARDRVSKSQGQGGGGGGATDVRYANGDGTWNHSTGLYSRIIVAGGGPGTHGGSTYSGGTIGTGGGTEATVSYYNSSPSSTAASQSAGGTDNSNSNGFNSPYEQNGVFGYF